MIRNQEDDEFVAVRVQDPRMQNEGSWNSYVDYKIFLHTNSKAFTAKTSCVRRRYSEFAWLKKKLQRNAGLVPVPDLPGKSFFFFSNEDFLEKRRKGLQAFLDNVVNMTVCLSDSQLHLFLQTQLPVGHIEDCVQGHTPYSVTDAILTYASSNRGFAQAQEDDSIKEPSLTVSYESMESPAPHQPCLQPKESAIPELLTCGDSDPLEGLLELRHQETSSVSVLQKNNHLEAVIEDQSPAGATFFVGDGEEVSESLSLAEETNQRSCQIQTPVEVHSLMENGFDEDLGSSGEVKMEKVDTEAALLDFKDGDREEERTERDASSQEVDLEAVCSEKQVLQNPVVLQVNGLEQIHVEDVGCCDELDGQTEPEKENGDESGIKEETQKVHHVPEVERIEHVDQQEVDVVETKDDEDSHSSSNESIVKVSDEESVCDETEDSTPATNGYLETPPEADASSRNILELHMNGCLVEDEDTSTQEDEDLHYISQPLDPNWTVNGGDLTENSDFSILECSCTPGLADAKCTEQESSSSLSLDASEETREVEVH